MISRILTKTVFPLARLSLTSSLRFNTPKFSFTKIEKAAKIKTVIDEQIKAESENLNDLASFEKTFKSGGWAIARENTLVELSRTVGVYQMRLLSNIKTPTSFEEQEGKQQKKEGEEEQDFQGEMNEVTICVSKTGIEKTLVINALVTQGFQITNIHFANNYQEAKNQRLDLYNTNKYTGPEVESLSQELYQSIYGFIEEELGITNQTMEGLADYCLQAEQSFYIDWLKDLRSIV